MVPRNTYLYLVPGMSICTLVLVHESSDDGMTIEHVHHSQSAVARTRHTLPRKPLVTASTAVDATWLPGTWCTHGCIFTYRRLPYVRPHPKMNQGPGTSTTVLYRRTDSRLPPSAVESRPILSQGARFAFVALLAWSSRGNARGTPPRFLFSRGY